MRIQCTDRCDGQATVCFSLDNDPQASQSISGRLRGPFCEHSRTLPSNFVIKNGKTVVVDPCFWSPKMPFLYEVQLNFESANGTQQAEFMCGLRWCVSNGSGLRLVGKPYVIRAIAADDATDLKEIRDLSASLIMRKFSEPICQQASQLGVLIVCLDTLSTEQAELAIRLPALHFAGSSPLLSSDMIGLVEGCLTQRNVCLTNESELSHDVDYASESPRFIVRRGVAGPVSDLRRECDRLQRDVASFGQFAGYLIHSHS